MSRLLGTLLLACLLASCSTFGRIATGDIHNISPAAVYKMEAAYTAAMVPLTVYRQLPFCSKAPAPCQTAAVARRIVTANADALRALHDLENFARQHPKLDATALIVAAQIAIGNAEALAREYGAKP